MVRRKPVRRSPSRGRPRPSKRRRAPWWLWLLALVVLGGFGYFLYYLSTGLPEPLKPARKEPSTPSRSTKVQLEKPERQEPRFTFYTLLPEKEVIIPEGEVRLRKREEHLGRVPRGHYFIQAGSFRSLRDADRLKAQLALLGLESRIEKAEIQGTVWHRVRLGPFTSMTEVEKIRDRLRKYRIDSVVQTAKR